MGNKPVQYDLLAKHELLYVNLSNWLLSTAPTEQNAEWLKATILLNGLVLKDPIQTFKYLQQLKSLYGSSSNEFEKFFNEFFKFIYPNTLTSHGYQRSLGSWEETEAWTEIRAVVNILKNFGYETFINSGTLLGAVREGRLLAHDDDADLGIILKGNTINEIVREMFDLKRKLKSFGRLSIWHEKESCYAPQFVGKLPVDLFPCWIDGNEMYLWPHGKTLVNNIYPLVTKNICDVEIPLPARPEALLELAYGTSWRTPDRTFTYNWSTAFGVAFEAFRKESEKLRSEYLDLLE